MHFIFRISQNAQKRLFASHLSKQQKNLHQLITDYDYSSIFRM